MLVMVDREDDQEGLMDERGERVRVDERGDLAEQPVELAQDDLVHGEPAQDRAAQDEAGKNGSLEPAAAEQAEVVNPQEKETPPTPSRTEQEAGTAEGSNMGSLMADIEEVYRSPRRGDVLEGTVVRVDKDGIMVDIGTKSEGVIPSHELQSLSTRGEEQPQVGDLVLVYVVQPENQDGHVLLSLRRARSERGWRTAQKQFEEGKTIEAEVIDYNRGGLIVNIDGVHGFVPMSQVVGLRHDTAAEGDSEAKMAAMVGRRISLKILEINRRRNRLILSERSAVQELRSQRKEQLLAELHEGQVRRGRVSSICDFGAFIDLGGADGLVHLSELAWGQVSHPSEVVKVGDELDVYVLGVDREKKKIALSLRRGQAEPWSKVAEKYHVGDLVTGRITKLAQFGAFARIEDGIEGLIHVSELGEGRIQHPKSVVKEGDVLTLRIIRIDPERRRLGLSLRQAEQREVSDTSPVGESSEQAEIPSSDEAPVESVEQ
jgi:small subunit ribosomal protein S1